MSGILLKTQPPGRHGSFRAAWIFLLVLALATGGAANCLALDEECSSAETDCELGSLLATYLAIEATSFRPPDCGLYGPALHIDQNDGLLNSLQFVGPVSLSGSLNYDAGFVNRPLHLIGCTPALVSASISVNAGAPTAVTEAYSYNSIGLVTRRILTTSTAVFLVDVEYAANDYPFIVAGDCQNAAVGRSISRLDYDLISRPFAFTQSRPLNCDAGSPNSRSITSTAGYEGALRSAVAGSTRLVESTGTVTSTSDVVTTANFTRDSAGRLTRRDQTDQITTVVSSPASTTSVTQSVIFTYTYDSEGRMTQFVGNRGPNTNAVINYGYDASGRVISMNSTGQQSAVAANSTDSFTYDAAGRILTHSSNFTLGANNIVTGYTFSY